MSKPDSMIVDVTARNDWHDALMVKLEQAGAVLAVLQPMENLETLNRDVIRNALWAAETLIAQAGQLAQAIQAEGNGEVA